MTLPITPKVLIRLGPGASFGAVFELGSALNGILGTNILGTATAQFADVTDTTQAIAVRHGRDRVFEQYTTGQATIQFQDFTGDWNPENAASPYYGQIKPMRQVIITGEYSGTEYPVFAGYITSWDWTWADEGMDLLDNGEVLLAERKFQELILARPDDFDGYEGLAMVCKAMGRREEAVMLIEHAVQLAGASLARDFIDRQVFDEVADEQREILNMPAAAPDAPGVEDGER